jgi:protein-L-isoaspartate(D-aspartate) O-methyltransferase
MLDFDYSRRIMVQRHLAGRGIADSRVLEAMRDVPRELFVAPGQEEFAYEDSPLGIGEGQTISQPYIVARMIEAAEIEAGHRVLEVGTGSGYAAAVISLLAQQVLTIERHRALGELAKNRLGAKDYRNVEVLIGDGSGGWPEKAPFDAIIVAAGGPAVPMALQEQLEIGGRLVMPVGQQSDTQRLVRVTRVSASRYEEEDLGSVLFVPLIGAHGWADEAGQAVSAAGRLSLPQRIATAMEDLPEPEDAKFGAAFDRFADRRVVLLGEASHGTSEFYRARAAITRRLIEHHGFTIVAVEADWPDAASINRSVRGRSSLADEPAPFQRFPTWMWRNAEMSQFLVWLRDRNVGLTPEQQAGFYGLDLYNMRGLIAYLDRVDPDAARLARERYGCLTPWQNDPATYGRMALSSGYRKCEAAVLKQCRELLESQLRYAADDEDAFLDATQNARLVASAEQYYRAMYYGGAVSWNLRDRHMFETLEQLLEAKGPDAKAVVWAHNSHIGDARETEMGLMRDELNIGQLCRERFGSDAALIGLGTHSGTVAAATDWDGQMEIKTVRPSLDGSVERCFHQSGRARGLLDFSRHEDVAELAAMRLERFIGVIYRPETERYSHYAQVSLSRQFDAYVWFDKSSAVSASAAPSAVREVPDTFPFGV